MSWVLLFLVVAVIGGVFVEKGGTNAAVRIRHSRVYSGGRHRLAGVWQVLRGRTTVYVDADEGRPRAPEAKPRKQAERPERAERQRRRPLPYTPPVQPAPNGNGRGPDPDGTHQPGVPAVDFFHSILTVVNARYETPVDALRQLRILTEGSRAWSQGLIQLHQRMLDPADMNIDPFVADHIIGAAALSQAQGMRLTEADAALTSLLHMTMAELIDRGMRVPRTK